LRRICTGSLQGKLESGTTLNTVWAAARLGVDEHVWRHVRERQTGHNGRGSKYLTGKVNATP